MKQHRIKPRTEPLSLMRITDILHLGLVASDCLICGVALPSRGRLLLLKCFSSPMVSLATVPRPPSEVVGREQEGSRWLFVLQARSVRKKKGDVRAEQNAGLCCLTHRLNGHIIMITSPLVWHSDKHSFLLCRFLCFPTTVSSLTQMNQLMHATHGTEAHSILEEETVLSFLLCFSDSR